jgi:hypothetical protein
MDTTTHAIILLRSDDHTSESDKRILPFDCKLQSGGYITVEENGRKASVFSFELFRTQSQTYYFGPVPSPLQPIFPEVIRVNNAESQPKKRDLFRILPAPTAACTLFIILFYLAFLSTYRALTESQRRRVLLGSALIGFLLAPTLGQAPAGDPLQTLTTLNSEGATRFIDEQLATAMTRKRKDETNADAESETVNYTPVKILSPVRQRKQVDKQMKVDTPTCHNRVALFRNTQHAKQQFDLRACQEIPHPTQHNQGEYP